MICHCKILVAALVVAQAQATVIAQTSESNFIVPRPNAAQRDWARIADLYNQNTVCSECDSACAGQILTPEEAKKTTPAILQWSCFVGCRTTCFLQMGTENYDYVKSKEMCAQGCHSHFNKNPKGERKVQLDACIQGCSIKVIPSDVNVAEGQFTQVDITEETETIMFDPSLKTKNGRLPHLSYKTLPHKESPPDVYTVFRRGLRKEPAVEHFWNVMKDPNTDPIFAGTVVLPLLLAMFALFMYTMYLITFNRFGKWTKTLKDYHTVNEGQEGDQFVTLLQIRLEAEEKEALLSPSDNDMDEDFVPPHTPPPKYSDIVQTV